MMKALIGYSCCPLTRKAFERRGFETWTCDLLPGRDGSIMHLQCDIKEVAQDKWDIGVFHPPCTYLTVSAAWALKEPDYERYPKYGYHQNVKPETLVGWKRKDAMEEAVENFKWIDSLPYPKAIENPAPSMLSKFHRPPTQIIQPYLFGDDASKGTGLWLDRLPMLRPTSFATPRFVGESVNLFGEASVMRWSNQTDSGQNKLSPSEKRWLERSETYPGIAAAMGEQWGGFIAGN